MSKKLNIKSENIFKYSLLALFGLSISACSSVTQNTNLALAPDHSNYGNRGEHSPAGETRAPGDSTAPQTADAMPHGGPVAAPTGFLEMCERSPIDCNRGEAYNPTRIVAQARQDLTRKYQLALAGLAWRPSDNDGQVQTAALQTASLDTDPKPAQTNDLRAYLNWPAQTQAAPSYAPRSSMAPLALSDETQTGFHYDVQALPVSDPADDLAEAGAPAQETAVTLADLETATFSAINQAADAAQPGALADSAAPFDLHYLTWSGNAPRNLIQTPRAAGDDKAIRVSLSNPSSTFLRLYNLQTRDGGPAPSPMTPPASDHATAAASDYAQLDGDGQQMDLVRRINSEVNGIIRQDTDQDIYHVADYWVAPGLGHGARGDCEDIALEKRRQLIAAGIPAEVMSIAIVKTRQDEDHAVLIVATRNGDYVLDSLAYDIRPWRKAAYTWISRQAPGDGLGWVSLAPANQRPGRAVAISVASNW
jgi:predicted transglutaminase-like cysteine proteinase